MTCQADCVQDTCHTGCIRPINSPKQLIWTYYEVVSKTSWKLEPRQFQPCACGCGQLQATPPVNVRTIQG